MVKVWIKTMIVTVRSKCHKCYKLLLISFNEATAVIHSSKTFCFAKYINCDFKSFLKPHPSPIGPQSTGLANVCVRLDLHFQGNRPIVQIVQIVYFIICLSRLSWHRKKHLIQTKIKAYITLLRTSLADWTVSLIYTAGELPSNLPQQYNAVRPDRPHP